MFIWAAAFCSGVIILYCGGFLLPWYSYISLIVFAFFCFRPLLFWLILFFVCGHFYAGHLAQKQIGSILPVSAQGKVLTFEAYLCSIPTKRERYQSAEFCIVSHQNTKAHWHKLQNTRVLLYWPSKLRLNIESPNLELKARLKRPHGTLNPAGGAYEKYLFFHRISATGVVIASQEKKHGLTFFQSLHFSYVLSRLRLSQYLDDVLIDLEHLGLFKALILGDKSAINALDADILSSTGTQHLMAISGLHVGVILLGLFYFAPKNKPSLILISLLGLLYVALVGFSVSSQRAGIMCIILMVYLAGFSPLNRIQSYMAALTFVLIIDPLATLNLGFWFSFICVALLLFLVVFGKFNQRAWLVIFILQLVLFIGLTPINNQLGLSHSLSNGLANLVAIPLVSLLILPGALAAFILSFANVALAQNIFFVLNEVLHIMMNFMGSLSVIAQQISVGLSVLISIALLICLVVSVMFYRFKGIRITAMAAIVILFLVPTRLSSPINQFVVFDVGQGLALAMIWEGQVWLYDTGSVFERSSIAQNVIVPYLRSRQLQENVSGMIVSHGDMDHAGGAESLFKTLLPLHAWSGEVNRLPKFDVLEACETGMIWPYGAGKIEVLYPAVGQKNLNTRSSNNHSCVIRFTIEGVSFLMMGDLESNIELELVKLYQTKLKSDVLIAGHHGSKNASSYALLKYVQPKAVVFSAGYLNRFGHPSKETVQRVSEFGPKIYNTSEGGSIIFDMTVAGAFKVTSARNEQSSFWLTK